MTILEHDFIRIQTDNKDIYGGNQSRFKSKRLRGYACGPVAVTNILAYERFARKGIPRISEEQFNALFKELSFFVPVIPKFGVNGVFMALGLNIYFWTHREKRFAVWGVFSFNIFKRIQKSLDKDEPVVLGIGPNFPNFFGKKTIGIYAKNETGYIERYRTNAHYVTVTGIDSEWLRISTWGEEAYINRNEFTQYMKKSSASLFTNILVIHGKAKP